MTTQRLKSLHVDKRPDLLIYDYSRGGDVFLEEQEEEGHYVVKLYRGQYNHLGTATGPGRVIVELFGAPGWDGRIISTFPDETLDGENAPAQIELRIVKDSL